MDEPPALNVTVNLDRGPGNDNLEELANAGLANFDNRGALRPQLAEAVPSTENGLWKLFPDGRMETTWKIKRNAQWQDGAPVTVEDFRLTATVGQDRELRIRRHREYDAVEQIDAPDSHTLVILWKRPFIEADAMFTRASVQLMPKHLLERAYLEAKDTFTELPYWTERFVGTGPFRVREWLRGSHVVFEPHEGYVLGRPKIDQVEVRFILDPNTLVANILAGEVELTLGRSLTLDPAIQVRDQWQQGKLELAVGINWFVIYPQMLNPSPALVADAQFRRALLHGTDRQQIVDTLLAGLVPIAHTRVSPTVPEYADIERAIVKYDFDPRRAAQLIESLGYRKGPDGIFRDAADQRLAVEIRTSGGDDLSEKSTLAVADQWQRLGIATEPVPVPRQRDRDFEYSATYPGFRLVRQPNGLENLADFHSSAAPVPENNFRGRNRPRYMNPEFDTLIDRYFGTIPRRERLQVAAQLERHITENLIIMPLYYNAEPVLIGNRLVNVMARGGNDTTHAWNAELWDRRGP